MSFKNIYSTELFLGKEKETYIHKYLHMSDVTKSTSIFHYVTTNPIKMEYCNLIAGPKNQVYHC